MVESVYKSTALNPNLQDIRILSVLPRSVSTEVKCSLERDCLGENPKYIALSYTWGDQNGECSIKINECPFLVTRNLSTALLNLRKDTKIFKIWVDAICINQKDDDERTSQVRQMKQIYEKARMVIVWLGDEDQNSSHAISAMNRIDRRWATPSSQQMSKRRLVAPNFEVKAVQAIYRLLLRPWWSRVWIIQEATCATTTYIKCGRDKVDFQAVEATVNYIAQNTLQLALQRDFDTPDIGNFQRVMSLGQLKAKRASSIYRSDLLGLLENARTCKASDPRDKIFALSGLAISYQRVAVHLDYSVPVDRTYMMFTKSLIEKEGTLNILGHCQEATQDLQSWSSFTFLPPTLVPTQPLPSWCPDWTMSLEATPFIKYEILGDPCSKKIYNSSGNFPPSVRLTEDMKTLFIRGFTFDTVSKLGANFTSNLSVATIRLWYSWLKMELGTVYNAAETTCNAFLHTLVADIGAWERRCVRGRAATWPIPNSFDIAEDSFQVGSHIRSAVSNRGIFISTKGLMGLARFDVSKGDKICIFHGGQVPFILQRKGDYYKFKGECYVHGLMDGEGMRYPNVWEDYALR